MVSPEPVVETRAAHVMYLDGVRAVAATFVVLHHFYLAAYPSFPRNSGPGALVWLLYGHLAVALFIVVSGISLTLGPARNGLRLNSRSLYIRRRAWRIIPAYWAAILVSVAVAVVVGGGLSGKSVLVHTLLLQDVVANRPINGAFWSIAVEWQIYFVFPLVLLALRRTTPAVVVAAAVGVSIIGHVLGVSVPILAPLDHVNPQFFALFVIGAACVVATRPDLAAKAWPRWLTRFALPASVVTVLLVFTVLGTARYAANLFWIDLLAGPVLALSFAALLSGGLPILRRELGRRTFALAGSFSYSVYLVHAPILALLIHFVAAPFDWRGGALFTFLLVVGLPVIFAGSYAFHLTAERPFLTCRSFADLRCALHKATVLRLRPPRPAPPAAAQDEEARA